MYGKRLGRWTVPLERRGTHLTAAIVGSLAGAILVGLPIGFQVPGSHPAESTCLKGAEVASANPTLTPLLLVNSPYKGNSTGTVSILNDTWNFTLLPGNGSTWGYFEHFGWSVFGEESRPGSRTNCSARLDVVHSDDETSTTFSLSNGTTWNFSNDSAEPKVVSTSWTAAPIIFADGFQRLTETISTCGSGARVRHVTSHHIDIGLELNATGLPRVLNVTVNITTWYVYTFPANTGIWEVDNLSAPGGPGGGWAFSYSPCP